MNDQQSYEHLASLKAFLNNNLLYITTIIGLGKYFNIDDRVLIFIISPFIIPIYIQNATRSLIEYKNFKMVFKNIFSRQNKQKKNKK